MAIEDLHTDMSYRSHVSMRGLHHHQGAHCDPSEQAHGACSPATAADWRTLALELHAREASTRFP